MNEQENSTSKSVKKMKHNHQLKYQLLESQVLRYKSLCLWIQDNNLHIWCNTTFIIN